jgi:hypothetical protein
LEQRPGLSALHIEEIPFTDTDGNVHGYAQKSYVAISPVAALPAKTLFHEIAHVVLGHTQESSISDSERTPKNLREVEAESVALLLCESLGLPGVTDHLKLYESGQHPGGIGEELMDNIVIIVARLSSSSGRGRRRVEVARVV